MKPTLEQNKLIYLQIAETIESDILKDILLEEEQVPSTNQFAKMLQINPATAAKGVNVLVDEGILYKKRGIGMFVAKERKKLYLKRQNTFMTEYLPKVWEEAKVLEISKDELMDMIQKLRRGTRMIALETKDITKNTKRK